MEENFSHDLLDLDQRNAIRLIELLPASTSCDDTIRCRLVHATTDISYNCLSYVWGRDETRRIIHINDRPFCVRENLWQFLKAAREAGFLAMIDNGNFPNFQHCLLWIDAICIDQENVLERNHQVQQMGEIYRNARYVLAWLGAYPRIVDFVDGLERTDADIIRKKHSSVLLKNAISFCENTYWQRAWITQEVSLARDLCLVATKSASTIRIARISLLTSKLSTYLSIFSNVEGGLEVFQPLYDLISRQRDGTLIENLWLYRHKKCQDRRDLVYSLLSMSKTSANLRVDYNLRISEVGWSLMRSLGHQFCLCYAKMTHQSLKFTSCLSMGDDQPFAVVRIKPAALKRRYVASELPYETWCGHCQEIFYNTTQPEYESSLEMFHYCLGCTHSEAGLETPGAHGIVRNGHFCISRHRHTEEISLLEPPGIGNNGIRFRHSIRLSEKSHGVQLLALDGDGQITLQLSLGTFERLVAIPLLASVRDPNHQMPEALIKKKVSEIDNPKWQLLVELV